MTIYTASSGSTMTAVRRETGALCRALYTNHPEAKTELGFRKGDILTVIEYDVDGQEGWWLCALRGQRGICPSNYLEVLEDKYSNVPPKSTNCSFSDKTKDESHQQQQQLSSGEGKGTLPSSATSTDFVNPLETYDFPRSVEPRPVISLGISTSTPACSQASLSQLSQHHHQSEEDEQEEHTYANDVPDDDDEPLYENDSVDPKAPEEPVCITKSSPLDLYDVPRSELPIYGQSISRLRKYGSCCNSDELAAARVSDPVKEYLKRGQSVSSLMLNSQQQQQERGVQLRRPPKSISFLRSNRSSVQSESAESGIGMATHGNGHTATAASSATNGIRIMHHHQQSHQNGGGGGDLYDVPRGTTTQVRGANSRPPSALSMTSSGMGLSIATSDSKDSLDGLYDVPRGTGSISVKTYVNHMEAKYDDVRRRQRHDSSSSTGSSHQSHLTRDGSVGGHTRHNSTSSIFSAYGYTKSRPEMPPPSGSLSRKNSVNGASNGQMSLEDMYDVPRGTCAHPLMGPPPPRPPSRPSTAMSRGSSSNGSLNSEDPMQFYDVPSQFTRKVGLEHGLSSSSLASSASSQFIRMTTNGSNNHHNSTSTNHMNGSSSNHGRKLEDGGAAAEVKLLPLGPKAAVSVCEKLRQEVVSSITSILSNVKPKWRTKENLTEIMPDLKFSCTRLCLAIKDVADFATRSLSNAKRLPDDTIAVRLHRLLTPVINGSQIIQRDVDELDAYFWSVDRLSLSGGDVQHPSSNHLVSSSDALDQLILCSRSLKHDVTELANFLALHSTALYNKPEHSQSSVVGKVQAPASSTGGIANRTRTASGTSQVVVPETKVEDTQEDYDYVSLVPNSTGPESDTGSNSNSTNSQKLSSALSTSSSTSTVSWHLDPSDQQLLEFYSAQISVTAPQLSQSIATFISAIQQNEPPSVFNIHLKYVILLAYKLLFAGDTVHRNIGNQMLKEEVESRSNDLHKSILTLYEASKIATVEFPKIAPMQMIVDRVWGTTQAATQLKKCIFNAVYTSV